MVVHSTVMLWQLFPGQTGSLALLWGREAFVGVFWVVGVFLFLGGLGTHVGGGGGGVLFGCGGGGAGRICLCVRKITYVVSGRFINIFELAF